MDGQSDAVDDPPSVRPKALSLRLAAFYFAYFAMMGVIIPYWPVWLQSRGLSAVEIGIVLAASRWLSVGTTPLIAQFADRRGESRRLLLVLMAGVAAGYAANSAAYQFWLILLISVYTSALIRAAMPVGDAMTLMYVVRRQVDYGRVRLWGSISFIGATFLGGELLGAWDADAVLWAIFAFAASTAVVVFFLPDTRNERTPRQRGALRRLVREPTLLTFLAAAALLSSSHAVLYAFGTIHWRDAGINDRIIGLLWAEGVIAEILLFAVGGAFMRRIRPADAMLMGAAGGILRWVVLGYSTDLVALFAVQILHGLTFGAAHLGAMAFVAQAAPKGYTATMQSLYNAVGVAGFSALAMIFVGPLYESMGGQAYYVMAALSLAAGVAAFVLRRVWDGRRLELPSGEAPTSAS